MCSIGQGQLAVYSVESIPFEPISIDSGATSLQLTDDQYLPVPLGFSFTYFESTYQSVTVGANGIAQFGAPQNMQVFNFYDPIPSPNVPVNAIFLAGIDLNPSQRVVRYKTIGQAPNRIFVLEYVNIPTWNCPNISSLTGQLRLFEGSNNIEMHIATFISCGADNPVWSGFAIQGIQNEFGTLAYTVEGRDLTLYWEANEESWRFIPGIVDTTQQYVLGGRVWLDLNGNCEVDEEDAPVANQVVKCEPGNLTTLTDAEGRYYFSVFPLNNFSITCPIANAIQSNYQFACPVNGSYSNIFVGSSDTLSNYNFFIKPEVNCADLRAFINPITPVLPCNQATRTQLIEVSNLQLVPAESYLVKLQLPDSVHFIESDPPYNMSDGNSFIWIMNEALPYQESKLIYWKDSLSCEANSASTICREVEIVLQSDCFMPNNSYLMCELPQSETPPIQPTLQVLNVLPIPLYDEVYAISQNSYQYFLKIHFQNTGTDTIQNIEITDSLANFFYPLIFDILSTTHACSTSRNGNIIKIYFQDIQLPPASEDADGSHLSVVFRIGADIPLSPGDSVLNHAELLMDEQWFSETNDILIYRPDNSANTESASPRQSIRFVPNPASQLVSILGEFHNHDLIMVDMLGRQIRNIKLQGKNPSVDLNGISEGIYHMTISNGHSVFSAPLLVFE